MPDPDRGGADAPTWPGGPGTPDRGAAPTWPGGPPTAPPSAPPSAPPGPRPPAPPGGRGGGSRRGGGVRTAVGAVLLVVAGLSAALAVGAGWTRARLRDEDTWAATSRALAEDPQVQRDVADALARRVVDTVGVEDALRGVLPGPLGSLADPVTERATDLVGEATLQLVRTEAFQDAWEAAVRSSHEELLAAFDGNGRFTAVTSEGIVLDLGSTLDELRALLEERGVPFLDQLDLSGIDLQFVLVDAPGLRNARDALEVLDVAVVVLPIVAVGAGLLGLLVARRRSVALAAGGVGALAGVAAVLLSVRAGRAEAVDQLTGGALGAGAAEAVVAEITSGIDAAMAAVAVAGAVLVVVGVAVAVATGRREPSGLSR